MASFSQFKGVYCSGIFILDPATVTTLSLLFEKVHLPNNVEIIKELSKRYVFKVSRKFLRRVDVNIEPDTLFAELNREQRTTANTYLKWGLSFIQTYGMLFPEVFETKLFTRSEPLKVKLIKKGAPGELNTYQVSLKPMTLVSGDERTFPRLVSKGYIPIAGLSDSSNIYPESLDSFTAKQLAALLGMKSVEMILPPTKGAHPETILEARERLKDHLPPFWSAMLKLSVQMRHNIRESNSNEDVLREAQDTVDTVVRPALIDLKQKMLQERKNWFYKILTPVHKGVRLLIGNPPLTQQQLITSALTLGADLAVTAVENMQTIEALKREAGLTFLLEAEKVITKTKKRKS